MTDANAIKRCKAFMAKNPLMAVGKIATVLASRGYSPEEVSTAFLELHRAKKEASQ